MHATVQPRLQCLAAALVLAAGPQAHAQITDFGSGTQASAQPLAGSASQLDVANTRPLAFGSFVAASGGAVTVSPGGSRTRTGGVILINSGAAPADFTVTRNNSGSASKSVILTLPANGEVVLSSGASAMPVRDFVNAGGALLPVDSGSAPLSIGATLVVAPDQPSGQYSGSFTVTVNYQ